MAEIPFPRTSILTNSWGMMPRNPPEGDRLREPVSRTPCIRPRMHIPGAQMAKFNRWRRNLDETDNTIGIMMHKY